MQVKRIATDGGAREVVRLSKREKQVLSGICYGWGYKEIAAQYGCCYSTVAQRARIMAAMLRVGGKDGLFRWAMAHQEIFHSDQPVEVAMHPEGCSCDSPYCQMMRKMKVA